jgi:lipopolysaccharide export system protein LptA
MTACPTPHKLRPDSLLLHPVRRAALAAAAAAAALLCLSAPLPALAEKADRDKPLAVESDRMEYDDIKQVGTFTGKVVLTKGTIVIRADRLTVRQDEEGWQLGTAWGEPATFRQKREGVSEWVEGRGRRIDYDGRRDSVRLQEQAMIRRTDGARVLDEIHGNDIVYESGTEFFTVRGSEGRAPTAANPSGRVRMVIQPRTSGNAAPDPATRLAPAGELPAPASR